MPALLTKQEQERRVAFPQAYQIQDRLQRMHHLEAEPLLAGEDAVDPALLVRPSRVERREGLCQPPEALVSASSVLDEEVAQGIATAAAAAAAPAALRRAQPATPARNPDS